MYEALLARIQEQIARAVFRAPQIQVSRPQQRPLRATHPHVPGGRAQDRAGQPPEELPGRNDPCWCDSGKKYKHCHMREDMKAQQGPVAAQRPPQTSGRKRRR
ncbi:MAG TPA: hypothetical protein ENN99_05395 [Chloroflexi bacterium]|nr:hypothetical protein [Chloroflexota bacterium]